MKRIPTNAPSFVRGAAAALALAACGASAAALLSLRSDQAGLPESIGRETFASIDRACDSLRAAAAPALLPARPDGAPDPRPAAALSDPGAPDPALGAALSAVAATLERPWGPRETEDAAFALLGAAFAATNPPPALVARLARARLDALPPASAALALVALDAFGADTAAAWDRLAERPVPAAPGLAGVAAAGLARQARARRRGPAPDAAPPPDVLAHARWVAARLDLGYGRTGDPAHPLDPENAFLAALLASSLPRRLLADPAAGLFPYDWRNHLADRLLSLQLADPPGTYRWTEPDGDDARATALAILALRLLAAP